MNIEALFEQDAHHYHQLQSDWIDATQKYPIVGCDYVSIRFITDIPLNISREQFKKLFYLSFNEQDIEAILHMQPQAKRNFLFGVFQVLNPKDNRCSDWIQGRIDDDREPSDYMCTWKQFVATIKADIHRFGDFQE